MAKPFDPLKYIPSASAIRKRLDEIEEEARRLGIVLKTAKEIEASSEEHAAEPRRGHAR